jgi:hypothetical protein
MKLKSHGYEVGSVFLRHLSYIPGLSIVLQILDMVIDFPKFYRFWKTTQSVSRTKSEQII